METKQKELRLKLRAENIYSTTCYLLIRIQKSNSFEIFNLWMKTRKMFDRRSKDFSFISLSLNDDRLQKSE